MRMSAPTPLAAWFAMLLMASGDAAEPPDSTGARKQAVEQFPELGRAGSPLNRKFLELYNRAKQAKSPVLQKADWPLLIAKQANAELSPTREAKPKDLAPTPPLPSPSDITLPISTEPIRFKVPVGEEPGLDPDGLKPARQYKEFTLKAQVIPPAKRVIPANVPPGNSPNVWRTLSAFRRAAKGGDIEPIKQLYVPEAWTLLDGGDGRFLRYMSTLADARVPLIAETDGRLIPILDAGNGLVKSLPMKAKGNIFLLDEPTDLSPETATALDELVQAMKKTPIDELIVK
jgi:hypothetical protein